MPVRKRGRLGGPSYHDTSMILSGGKREGSLTEVYETAIQSKEASSAHWKTSSRISCERDPVPPSKGSVFVYLLHFLTEWDSPYNVSLGETQMDFRAQQQWWEAGAALVSDTPCD